MAFTLQQRLEHYRRHPELRAALQQRWRQNQRRRQEIQAAKDILMSAHRLRQIGVRPAWGRLPTIDSWKPPNEE